MQEISRVNKLETDDKYAIVFIPTQQQEWGSIASENSDAWTVTASSTLQSMECLVITFQCLTHCTNHTNGGCVRHVFPSYSLKADNFHCNHNLEPTSIHNGSLTLEIHRIQLRILTKTEPLNPGLWPIRGNMSETITAEKIHKEEKNTRH